MHRHVPTLAELLVLALAAFRLTRLVGWDVLTRPLRVRLTHRAEQEGTVYVHPKTGELGGGYRPLVDEFIHCPWCVGFWLSLGVWAAWLAWPSAMLVVATPLALSALVGLVAKNWDP